MKSFLSYILTFMLSMWLSSVVWSQVITPATGFNYIACGTNTTLCDAGGCSGNYPINSSGYTVIRATGDARITISGSFVVEGGGWDYIRIFDGVGTGGTLIYHSGTTLSATINYTAAPGQSLTVQLISDESFNYSGYNFNITFSGNCAPVSVLPSNGTMDFACGQNAIIVDNGGMAGDYTINNNSIAQLHNSNGAIINLYGQYYLGAGDTLFVYRGIGTNGTLLTRFTGNGVLNYNSGLGEPLTIVLRSNGVTNSKGIDFLLSYNGLCECPTVTYTGDTSLCRGDTVTLSAIANIPNNSYSVSNINFAPLPCAGGATVVSGDDMVTSPITLPFVFKFFGQDFTQVGISTNGNIQLGAGPYNDAFTSIGPIPGTNVRNMIALNYSDWVVTATNASVTYQTIGTAPNQIFQVCFNNLTPFGHGTNGNLTGQILLYETSNVVEMHISQNSMPAVYNNQTQGMQYAVGTGVGYMDRNFSFWTASDTAVRFDPNLHFNWSPNAGGINATNPNNITFTSDVVGEYTYINSYKFGYCDPETDTIVFRVQDASAVYQVEDALCFGANTAEINYVSGNATSFTWSNGATTASLSNVAAGAYTVTASLGTCQYTESFTVSQPSQLDFNFHSVEEVACNGSNGELSVTASGGTSPYSYVWSNGATTPDNTGLPPGTHVVTITDANGCSVSRDYTLVGSTLSVSVASLVDSVCYGESTGLVTIEALPNTAQILWSTGAQTPTISGLAAGQYVVTVTSLTNVICEEILTIDIYQPTMALNASIDVVIPVDCFTPEGELLAIANGGWGNYQYLWSTGNNGSAISGLSADNYYVTVTDEGGCTAIAMQELRQMSVSVSVVSVVDSVCYGANTGSIGIEVFPNTASINWSTGDTDVLALNGLAAGNYSVTASISSGVSDCQEVISVEIYEPTHALQVGVNVVNDIDCIIPQGELVALANGGWGDYTYRWNNQVSTSINDNLAAGTYIITVTDAFGCQVIGSAIINPLSLPNLEAYIGQSGVKNVAVAPSTSVDFDARLSDPLVASLWSYTWHPINHNYTPNTPITPNQANIEIPEPGEYYFRVVSQYGDCILNDTLSILVLAEDLKLPTAFTPNNDGENDLFRPVNFNPAFLKSFKVINRWGQTVYESGSVAAWDGTYKDEPQPRDVYMYLIEYQRPQDAEVQVLRGQFTLLR